MIITPDFVFVHYPKTGGTFVTHALSCSSSRPIS
jgi:hypothetical protein